MDNNLMQILKCGICKELARDAVETTYCHHIFCTICLAQVTDRSCPTCRKENISITESHLARRLINETSARCEFCKLAVKRGNLSDHQMLCPCRIITCPAPNCAHSGTRDEFIQHIASSHSNDLIQNAAALFQRNPTTLNQTIGVDPIGTKTDANGHLARLGETAKYYCGGRLSPACDCCDGLCGPTNGCNCEACMKLDLEARRLPRGYLVNRRGAPAIKLIYGHYYCGQKIMGAGGYCGKTTAENCGACRTLDNLATSLYRNIS